VRVKGGGFRGFRVWGLNKSCHIYEWVMTLAVLGVPSRSYACEYEVLRM